MLERNPTLKAEMEAIEMPDDATTKGKSVPVAFYIYPVMQVANILMSRAHLVPVGEDQLPHIELTRETARRFNREFKPIFPEPRGAPGAGAASRGHRWQCQDEQVARQHDRPQGQRRNRGEEGAPHVRRPSAGREGTGQGRGEPDLSVPRCVRSRRGTGAEPEGALRTHGRQQQGVEGSADNGPE